MKFSMCAQVMAEVAFTNVEWELLVHEFTTSREYGRLAQEGGWFYGQMNHRSFCQEDKEEEKMLFTFRQLDIMTKILEMPMLYGGNKVAFELSKRLGKCLTEMNNTGTELYNLLSTREYA